jgi:NADP-dependent 3-hydroxy acid dehydrogenase YdfG
VALVARSEDALRHLADDLAHGSFAAPCDITDESSVRRMSEVVESAFDGAPDIVVNNAGVFRVARLEAMPEDLFTTVLDTNLVGPYLIVRAFVRQMRTRGTGHFITIGSIADRNIFPENGAYAPAKYALRAMHEVLREELKGSGVRATLVSPGSVDTSMWDGISFGGSERIVPDRGAMLRADDVAAAVLYAVTQPASVNVDELRISHA